MITKKDLECEIKELQLEIEEKARVIGKLKDYLNQREYQLKKMNDAQRNTNEAVENKLKEEVNKLQVNNWKVLMQNVDYPMLEVIDENTIRIEGVKYQKVDEVKSPTLYDTLALQSNAIGFHFNEQQREWICDTVRGWLIDHTFIETEDEDTVTFTIHKEQLQTPK